MNKECLLYYITIGGTLKIYGDSVKPDVPYKTLLLSTGDTVAHVVRETLGKYGLEKDDAGNYCLVQVRVLDTLTLNFRKYAAIHTNYITSQSTTL